MFTGNWRNQEVKNCGVAVKAKNLVGVSNPLRAWPRRLYYGIKNRPDVQIKRLERRIEVLESCLISSAGQVDGWREIHSLLQPWKVLDLTLTRFGAIDDGGYLLPIKLVGSAKGAVSIGVGTEISADRELVVSGIPVHAWDHTVTQLPEKGTGVVFHPLGLGNDPLNNLLVSLSEIVDLSFGPELEDLILMLDCEGAEWETLTSPNLDALKRFSIISAELHFLGNALVNFGPFLESLLFMNEYFLAVSTSSNNYSATWSVEGITLPDYIEITWVNRKHLTASDISSALKGTITGNRNCPDIEPLIDF